MTGWWSEEAITLLRAKWGAGLSATQIAKKLASDLHVRKTRNAVIGKVHRLGLACRATPSRPARMPVRPRARPSVPNEIRRLVRNTPAETLSADLESIRAMAPMDPTLTVTKLSRFTCRHPIGDPKHDGFAFCGRTCEDTYCLDHAKLNYARPAYAAKVRKASERLASWLDNRSRGHSAMVAAQ